MITLWSNSAFEHARYLIDDLAKKQLPLVEDDFLEVLYQAYLRKKPGVCNLTEVDKHIHIKFKILNLRGYLKLYRTGEMQGKFWLIRSAE